MIEIHREENRLTVKGHAGYAEPGKDIVCAAVSILAQNLIQSIEELTPDKTKYSILPGRVCIEYRNLSEKAKSLFDSFFIGIRMVIEDYPENVRMD